jgi:hypothetical protein
MTWRKYFTQVDNAGLPVVATKKAQAGGSVAQALSSKISSWLPEVYGGSPDRFMRYIQYDQMDNDLEISTALNIIAEFGTQINEENSLPFAIKYEEKPGQIESTIIVNSLKQWCRINKFNKRIFRMFRNTIKYGDQFFIRDPQTYELLWVDPANVTHIINNESEGSKIEFYFIKNLSHNITEQLATKASPTHGRPYGSGQGLTAAMSSVGTSTSNFATGANSEQGVAVAAEHVVHLSLSEGLDGLWPFSLSILAPVFKIYKQKELLEDSIIIYRVHRAPERRVFTIDVGNMPAHKADQYLEKIKYEVQQKRVPNKNSQGQNVMDAAYNPMSILEDFFFASTADGRGSKVDTLPSGENLGQIDDLRFFSNKLFRGLGIPSSYLPTGPEDGTAQFNDGKVGVAYIQEFRFANYVQRLQRQISDELDFEFKMFLKKKGVELDVSNFHIEFNEPMSFGDYRTIQLESERAQLFSQISTVPYLSNQFKLKKYLGLTEDEIKLNEKLWMQENPSGDEAEGSEADAMDLGDIGTRPLPDMDVSMDEPDLSDMETMDMGDLEGGDVAAETPPPTQAGP